MTITTLCKRQGFLNDKKKFHRMIWKSGNLILIHFMDEGNEENMMTTG